MKTYCLCLSLFLLTVNFASGEIKNGYTNGIHSAWASLKNLQALLHDNKKKTASQKRMLQAKLKEAMNYIAYYELTQNLLNQFKSIATELYNEIDAIKDRRGRSTDVYIKFISSENAGMQVS